MIFVVFYHFSHIWYWISPHLAETDLVILFALQPKIIYTVSIQILQETKEGGIWKKMLNHAFNYITAILIFICAMTVSLSIFLVKVQNSIDTNSQNIMTSTVSHQSNHVLSILQIHYGFLNSIADKMGKSSELLSDENMELLVSMAENTDFERTALIEIRRHRSLW